MIETTSLREEVKSMIDNADEKTLRMVYAMLSASAEEDWWNELNIEEKKDLENAIAESEKEENYIPYEKFKNEFDSWRKELLSSKEQIEK